MRLYNGGEGVTGNRDVLGEVPQRGLVALCHWENTLRDYAVIGHALDQQPAEAVELLQRDPASLLGHGNNTAQD